jgi:predicted PurR-regulated permease PerM
LAGLTEAAAFRVATRTVLFTFGLLAVVWLLVRLQAVVIQVILAVILAAGMTPLVNRLAPRPDTLGVRVWRRRWSPPRALIVLFVYAALVAVITSVGMLVIPPVVDEIEDLVRRLPTYGSDFQEWLTGLPERYPFLPPDLRETLEQQLRASTDQIAAVLQQALVVARVIFGVLGGALNGIFILFLALYITVDNERIQRYMVGFLPEDRREQALAVSARIGDRLGGWIRGQILLSTIIGTITLIGLSLIGVRYAMLLSILAGLGEAVPMVGPIFSAIPAVIIATFQSPVQGLLTLILYIVIQQVENSLVVPKVMERAVSLHPLAVMVALLVGGELLGVAGAILAVPVAAALSVIVDEARRERDRAARPKGTALVPETAATTAAPSPGAGAAVAPGDGAAAAPVPGPPAAAPAPIARPAPPGSAS